MENKCIKYIFIIETFFYFFLMCGLKWLIRFCATYSALEFVYLSKGKSSCGFYNFSLRLILLVAHLRLYIWIVECEDTFCNPWNSVSIHKCFPSAFLRVFTRVVTTLRLKLLPFFITFASPTSPYQVPF